MKFYCVFFNGHPFCKIVVFPNIRFTGVPKIGYLILLHTKSGGLNPLIFILDASDRKENRGLHCHDTGCESSTKKNMG